MASSRAGCLPGLPVCNLLQSELRSGGDRCYLSSRWMMLWSYLTSSQTWP